MGGLSKGVRVFCLPLLSAAKQILWYYGKGLMKGTCRVFLPFISCQAFISQNMENNNQTVEKPQGVSQMKKKYAVLSGMLAVALMFVSTVYAQSLKTGSFAYPGTDLILRFLSNGTVQGITNSTPNSVSATGRYNISGSRLTITFNNQASGDWQIVAGKTFVYTIDDDETFSGNGEQWVRIGN
jgi:hypothetical protein